MLRRVAALQFHPYSWHLFKLAELPEERRKRSRGLRKFLAICVEAIPIKIVSSANKAWLMGRTPFLKERPGRDPSDWSLSSLLLRESATRI